MPPNKLPSKPSAKTKEVIILDKIVSDSKLRVNKRNSRLSP
jgi:hypothetical protein